MLDGDDCEELFSRRDRDRSIAILEAVLAGMARREEVALFVLAPLMTVGPDL